MSSSSHPSEEELNKNLIVQAICQQTPGSVSPEPEKLFHAQSGAFQLLYHLYFNNSE